MKEKVSRMAAFVVPWGCILFICVMLVVCNVVTLSIKSFAVDSQDRLYIGQSEVICVYEGDELVNQISAQTSRAYQFTVQSNDTVLLSTASKVYIINMNGEILDEYEDVGTKTYNKLQRNSKTFTSNKGDKYQIKDALARTKIVKNNTETVYQIPVLSVVVKLLIELCLVSIILFVGKNVTIK
jgi:hypothetical protein